jgi:hypothetical protein
MVFYQKRCWCLHETFTKGSFWFIFRYFFFLLCFQSAETVSQSDLNTREIVCNHRGLVETRAVLNFL